LPDFQGQGFSVFFHKHLDSFMFLGVASILKIFLFSINDEIAALRSCHPAPHVSLPQLRKEAESFFAAKKPANIVLQEFAVLRHDHNNPDHARVVEVHPFSNEASSRGSCDRIVQMLTENFAGASFLMRR
jgi:hypothetical protein